MIDRPLVFVGAILASAVSLIIGLVPSSTTTEVITIKPEDITVIPPRQEILTREVVLQTVPEAVPEVAPLPESKRIPSDKTMRCPKWEAKFAQHGLPVETFSYIAWRESRCRLRAWNTTLNADGSSDLGLVQINSSWKKVTSQICNAPYGKLEVLFNVDCNLSVAKYLYENGGLGHWRL